MANKMVTDLNAAFGLWEGKQTDKNVPTFTKVKSIKEDLEKDLNSRSRFFQLEAKKVVGPTTVLFKELVEINESGKKHDERIKDTKDAVEKYLKNITAQTVVQRFITYATTLAAAVICTALGVGLVAMAGVQLGAFSSMSGFVSAMVAVATKGTAGLNLATSTVGGVAALVGAGCGYLGASRTLGFFNRSSYRQAAEELNQLTPLPSSSSLSV